MTFSAYRQFAYVYDQLMQHAPYDEWVSFTVKMIENYQMDVQRIVDLGCGTGEISIRLAKLGYGISGIDQSAEMLAIADEKARQEQVRVPFIKQDIRSLEGVNGVDLFLSYCDVFNYLTTESDLQLAFQRVYDCLKQNGFLIFDIHNIYFAENNLMNQTFSDFDEELAYIWKCHRGEIHGEMFHEMHFFQQSSKDQYIHFEETHHQRTFTIEVYEKLLEASGFTKIEFLADFQTENQFSLKNSERIFIIAQK